MRQSNMRILRVLVLVGLAFPASVRSQQTAEVPGNLARPGTGTSPAIAGLSPQASGSRQPPSSSQVSNPVEPAAAEPSRFVLELNTDGLLGPLQGGLFFGRGNRRLTAGLAVYVTSIRLAEFQAWGGAIGPGVRWAVLRAVGGRLDLLVEAHALLGKQYESDYERWAIPDGYSVALNLGPGLRFWLTDALSIAYVGLVSNFWYFDRDTDLLTIRASQGQSGAVVVRERSATARFLDIFGAVQLAGYF
jgi:hypothetical protein